MFFFAERNRPSDPNDRWWNLIAFTFGTLVFALAVVWGLAGQDVPLDWRGTALLLGFNVALLLLSGQKRDGLYVSAMMMVCVTAYLIIGVLGLVIVAFGGLALSELLRPAVATILDLKRHTPVQSMISIALQGGATVYALVIAGIVFNALGCPVPLTHFDQDEFIPVIIFFAVSWLLYLVPLILAYRVSYGALSGHKLLLILRWTLVNELLFSVFGLLNAVIYQSLSLLNFAGILFFALIAIIFFRVTQINSNRLERRVRELALINAFGQSLTTKLSLNELLQTLHDEIRKLIPLEFFVVSLYDQATDHWEFPYISLYDSPQKWHPQTGNFGMGHYLIQTRRPLLIKGDVNAELKKIGIDEALTPPLPRSLIATPLIAGNRVIGTMSIESLNDDDAYQQIDLDLMMTIAPQAAAAIANAQLYSRVTNMADQLQQINQISTVISATLDLNAILEIVCRTLLKVYQNGKAAVFLTNEASTHSSMVYSIGLSEDYRGLFGALPHSGALNDPNFPFIVSDIRSDPRGLGWRSLAQIGDYVAFALVPMRVSDRLIGQLAVFFDDVHLFTEPELRLLDTFANQVAVAVANARLYHEAQIRADDMTELVDSSHALIESFEINNVGATTVQRLQKALGLDETALILWDFETESLQPLASATKRLIDYSQIQESVLIPLVRHQQPVALPQSAADRRFLEALGLQTALALPLVLRSETVGIAILGRTSVSPFSPRERQFAEALLNQTATALDNARLFRLIDTELESRIQQLSAIENVSRKVSATLDQNILINEMIEAALSVTSADTATIGLQDSPGVVNFVRQTRQMEKSYHVWPIGQGITGRVMRTGEPELIPDISRDRDYVATILGMRSEICVPIIVAGKPVGVLDIESKHLNIFNQGHVTFLTTLAEHAAIAIEKATLFNDIQRRNEEMRAILGSTRDGMILISAKGILLQANAAAERLLNLNLSQMIGQSAIMKLARNAFRPDQYPHIHYPYDKLIESLRHLRESPHALTKQVYPVLINGTPREIEEIGIPVHNEGDEAIARLFVLRDVTEDLELERFKEHLTETVVHDLRSPLGSVITSLYLIQEATLDGDVETVNKVTDSALVLANDLLNLVTSILETRKMQSGKLPLDRVVTPLSFPAHKALQIARIAAQEHAIRVLDRLPADLPNLYIDQDKVKRVLVNLLDNALKYTPQEGEVRVEAHYKPGDPMVTVTVVDTGKGIPEDYRDKVFDMFVTVPKELSTPRRRGTGIGLTFCRLTVEAHGGKIWVESGREGGAAIRFTLPIAGQSLDHLSLQSESQREAAH